MGVADARAFFRRPLALLAILPEHLAPPIIAVPRLRHSGLYWISVDASLLNHFAFSSNMPRFPITAITRDVGDSGDRRALRALPHPLGPQPGFQRTYFIQPQNFRAESVPNHVELTSNRVEIGLNAWQTELFLAAMLVWCL
jgi:hypothetical protein